MKSIRKSVKKKIKPNRLILLNVKTLLVKKNFIFSDRLNGFSTNLYDKVESKVDVKIENK